MVGYPSDGEWVHVNVNSDVNDITKNENVVKNYTNIFFAISPRTNKKKLNNKFTSSADKLP